LVRSPLPIIVAGGGGTEKSLVEFATSALVAGCHGLAVGRRVFTNPAPRRAVRELAAIVHSRDLVTELSPQPRMEGVL
jgi:2-amino-4,5-dihydroxy-6-oxo-7-(phosphonooxy)heptanoate synthase